MVTMYKCFSVYFSRRPIEFAQLCGRCMACRGSSKRSAIYSYLEWNQENLDKGINLVKEENASVRAVG